MDRVRSASSHHRSLLQPREPAFWVFASLVGYGALRMASVLTDLSAASRSGWALSWLLLVLYAIPVAVVVYRLDLYEREPLSLVGGAFVWGAFAATALALDAAGWDQIVAQVGGRAFAMRWAPAIAAPIVEEILKGAGIVLIYLIARDEVDDAMDGFVYGAICGLGFAVVEDVVYFMAVFGGTPAGVFQGFYVRVLSSGLYGHVLYTGLVGLGIGSFVTRREEGPFGRRLAVAAAYAGTGVLGHALWNAPWLPALTSAPATFGEWAMLPLALALRGMPLLVLVAVAVRAASGRERRWLDGALAGEVAVEQISEDEVAVLRVPRRRRAEAR
ncbi:MAG: PrsW family intramembrane metalloprotease, partial [Actinomycetota bacterium]